MSTKTIPHDPDKITVNCMYVITRDASTKLLSCAYESMGVDESEEAELKRLASELRSEEERIADSLVKDLGEIYGRVFNEQHHTEDESPLQEGMSAALEYVKSGIRSFDPSAKGVNVLIHALENKHTSPICLLFMAPFAEREFKVPENEQIEKLFKPEDVDAAKTEAQRLAKAWPVIEEARERYRRSFEKYYSELESRVPGITTPKEYCPNLKDSYVEMDYRRDPINAQIVDHIDDYYRAKCLEDSIAKLSKRNEVIGFSTRYHGYWDKANHCYRDIRIVLDQEADLDLTIRTNFGYGRSSYFYSTISFLGINVINADLIIYYHGIKETEYARATNVYEVEEQSFQLCFDEAVKYHHELREMGTASFVERHVKGSIEKLANLMYIIARTDTFLEISSLALFSSITSADNSVYMPGLESSKEDFVFDETSRSLVARLADSYTVTLDESGIRTINKSNEYLDELQTRLSRTRCLKKDVGRQLAQLDMARQVLVSLLRNRFGEEAWVIDEVESILPMPHDAKIRKFEGYDLLDFRAEKVQIVCSLIDDIRKATEAISGHELLSSLISSCKLIGSQCAKFLEETLNPEITRIKEEGLCIRGEIDAIEGLEDDAYLERRAELDDLKQAREALRKELEACNDQGKNLLKCMQQLEQLS